MWKIGTMLEKFLWIFGGTLMILHYVKPVPIGTNSEKLHNITFMDYKNPINLEYMNLSVHPCKSFYNYACGGWIEKMTRLNNLDYNVGKELTIKNLKLVLGVREETLVSKAEQKAMRTFKSCLHKDRETLGSNPLLELLHKLGGWSVSNSNFSINNWNLQNILEVIHNEYSVPALFSYKVEVDEKNSSRNIIKISQSKLRLPTKYYLNKGEHEKDIQVYLEYMTKVGILLGGHVNDTKMKMDAVLKFKTKLANITFEELERNRDSTYNLMTINELQEIAGFIDWKTFFENAMSKVGKKITPEEEIVVYAPEYFINLSHLIKKYNATEKDRETLNNYLIWQLVQTYTKYLSKEFMDAEDDLQKTLRRSIDIKDLKIENCGTYLMRKVGFAIGAIFVRNAYNDSLSPLVEKHIIQLKEVFKKYLQYTDWLDSRTREFIEDRVNSMTYLIGYPDFIKDPKRLDDYYAGWIAQKETSYFENILNLNHFNLIKNLEKINKPVIANEWSQDMSPVLVNAQYDPRINQITITAGILQRPIYDPENAPSFNFGSLVSILGHELIHAFDMKDKIQFGNNSTKESFISKTKCFLEKYRNFEIYGIHPSGENTIGEDIADNGGLNLAYRAYLEYMKDKSPPYVPGPYILNHKQLFFLGFAQDFCSTITREGIIEKMHDAHSPDPVRVIVTLSNSYEFSEAFGCPFNPLERCVLW